MEKIEDIEASSLWSNTPNYPDNPVLIIAEILQSKGLGISIDEDAKDNNGRPLYDYVRIKSPRKGKDLLRQITGTAESKALYNLRPSFQMGSPLPSKELLYREIADISWRNRAYKQAVTWEVRSIGIRTRAEMQFENPNLTLEDIRDLLTIVVDREIAIQQF